jgi:hypothetical protein
MLSYHARLALEFFAALPPAWQTPARLAGFVSHIALSYALSPARTTSLLTEATAEAARRGLVSEEEG